MNHLFLPTTLLCALLCSASGADSERRAKPVLLYSRYYNAEGETRYLPDGTFKEVLGRLGRHFDIRIHRQPLTADTLTDVNLLLIANPSDQAVSNNPAPPHVSPSDVKSLTRFVDRGGGLILMGNQENHNLEIHDVNKLLANFGLRFTNLYTDAKQLTLPKQAPIIGGLRWAYYTGNQIVIERNHPAKPRALVVNDLSQKPAKGTRDEPGALLATAEPGRGHVVVVTDAGWVTDDALNGKGIGGVAITDQDNWEIFLRLTRWATGQR